MIRSLLILFAPLKAWEKIAAQQWNVLLVFFISVSPLMVASCAVEGWAMIKFGAEKGNLGRLIRLDNNQIITFEIIQLGLGLFLLFVGAKFIQWTCEGFHNETTYKQAFTLTAYGLTPLFWMRFLDGFPAIPSWLCWGLGALGILIALYHGVALVIQPNTSVGFGMYLLASMTLIAISGLCHFLALGVAYEKFNIKLFVGYFYFPG
jgi:hypothetical protein